MKEEETFYETIGNGIKDSIQSQMFGKPCFKIGKKAFTCFHEDAMVFKLNGDTHQEALSLDGTKLFDPSGKGRAMKEWVQVPYEYKDRWKAYAERAMEYVGGKD